MRLTKRTVDSIKSPDKAIIIWDAEMGGFGVKISPSGRKAYVVQYRISGQRRKTRRKTLGVHGTITCEQARIKARGLLGKAAFGENPLQEKDEIKTAILTAELLDVFYNEHVLPKLADRLKRLINILSKENYQSRLSIYLSRTLHVRIVRLHIKWHRFKSGLRESLLTFC